LRRQAWHGSAMVCVSWCKFWSSFEPKDISDIGSVREQIDELQKELLMKEKALRSAENTVGEMNVVYPTIDELRRQVSEKEAPSNLRILSCTMWRWIFGIPAMPECLSISLLCYFVPPVPWKVLHFRFLAVRPFVCKTCLFK
jgi:hypothetical protein